MLGGFTLLAGLGCGLVVWLGLFGFMYWVLWAVVLATGFVINWDIGWVLGLFGVWAFGVFFFSGMGLWVFGGLGGGLVVGLLNLDMN